MKFSVLVLFLLFWSSNPTGAIKDTAQNAEPALRWPTRPNNHRAAPAEHGMW